MNAETGSEPEAPKKRGRIPQSAWPQILERYRSGATLSAIAREFECTPSAISYIIRKAEAAGEKDAPVVEEGAAADDVAEAPAGDAMAEEPPPAPVVASEAPAPVKPARRAAAPAPVEAPQPRLRRLLRRQRLPSPPRPSRPLRLRPRRCVSTVRSRSRLASPLRSSRRRYPPLPSPPPSPLRRMEAPAGTNPPPVDAVEARLRDTARGCLNAYRGWRQQPGEASIQTLSEAVHELRKALARIEIDMSASRREEQAIRPIPIPAHRTARRTP
ncbi:helix-turn-helix domain-containing protein [Azospirillum sp. Marseille-Q6669]